MTITLSINKNVPRGTILIWSGLVANIPTGWQLCNGTNGTPDLRNKFVLAASQDNGGRPAATTNAGLINEGGNWTHTHFVDISHDHGFGSATAQAGSDYSWYQDPLSSVPETDIQDNAPPFYVLAYIQKL